ncbi:hypothetical protein BDY21DRAFT_219151 [Lineolata rhizophorae]|uniref:Uncharacterized protein n=1 Tax=Lineolata rhizophorae TaxID=578093 RepID=A0A6A6P313_9PEZI|nr:hypothetical protein BDY21DRAFT_219151 [Lineolata rhizophorae]
MTVKQRGGSAGAAIMAHPRTHTHIRLRAALVNCPSDSVPRRWLPTSDRPAAELHDVTAAAQVESVRCVPVLLVTLQRLAPPPSECPHRPIFCRSSRRGRILLCAYCVEPRARSDGTEEFKTTHLPTYMHAYARMDPLLPEICLLREKAWGQGWRECLAIDSTR